MRIRHVFSRLHFILFTLLFLVGCSSLKTNKSHYAGIAPLLEKGDYEALIQKVERAKEEKKAYSYKNRVVYYLDIGLLLHWKGEYEKSNIYLEKAERAIDDNFTKSVTRAASSLIGNDNLLAYSGEDYEDIYLNVFKALNYFALHKNDDAFVEMRRMNNKLVLLESKYDKVAQEFNKAKEAHTTFRSGKNPFQESSLGRVLSLILYRDDLKWDDARIDLEKINRGWKLQPRIYSFSEPDLSALIKPIPSKKTRLDLLAFTGLAPDKKAKTFYIHTEENVIILAGTKENYFGNQVLSGGNVIYWDEMPAGYHFKFQLPYMKRRPSQVARVEVSIKGVGTYSLPMLDSLENVAVETFKIKKPLIYFKTVIRAVLKGLAAEKGKQKATEGMDSLAGFLVRVVADVAVDLTENADLRTSRFFPAKAYFREVYLDEGTYEIQVNYYGKNNLLLYSDKKEAVLLSKERINLLESVYLN